MTIRGRIRLLGLSVVAATALVAICLQGIGQARAESTVTVAITSDFASWNPYADSTAQMYGIWCQVYGCLVVYDADAGEFKGLLADRWEVDKKNHNVWIFHLRKGLKRHGDGKELTAEDVVHTVWRTGHDKHSAQKANVRPIKSVEAVDKYTVKFITKKPTADLLVYLADKVFVTGKDLYDKYGARKADHDHPLGWGPYMLKDISIGQRMVLEKNPNWPGIKKQNPDRLIFIRVKEAEARLTGLLNGEIQIAQLIPPHLLERIKDTPGVTATSAPSVEGMFLAMNPAFKPWDNKLARQAVAYAINRELIIKQIFKGYATILHGPVGKGQYAWNPDVGPKYHYDPKKARALLEKAGLVGTTVDFYTCTERYMYDRATAQAMVPMLEAAGFKVRFHAVEYSVDWPLVRKGKRPFYYHGRGSMIDPSAALSQYFQTGVTPRIRYSNPKLDKVFADARAEFNPEKRKKLLQESYHIILQDVPAFFLWRINVPYGIRSDRVEYRPTPHNRVYGTDIIVK